MVFALALSDIHDNIIAFKTILDNVRSYDFIIMGGDICEFNCIEFARIFRNLEVPIIITHGNHDCVPSFEVLNKKLDNFYYIKNNYITIDINGTTLNIGGLGGVFSPKRSDMHHFASRDIIKLANKLLQDGVKLDLLITHECAKNCSDIIPHIRKRGGKSELYLLHIVSDPKIHICGHMHTPWVERFRETMCINPGYGFAGLGAVIDINSRKAKLFQVKLKFNLINEHRVIYSYNWVRNVKRSYFRILRSEANRLRLLE